MKTIVTGGCGFIGTHLVRRLVEFGVKVDVLDNESSSVGIKIDGATYHHCNIEETESFPAKLFEGVDCVFHLAAVARIQDSISNPLHTAAVNIIGTVNVLEACRKAGVPKLVNSSTSSVYGLTESFPTSEDTETDCLNPYAATKLAAEEMIRCYTKLYGIEAFNLRYFNVFGEDSLVDGPYSLVIGIFLEQRKNGVPLTVVGDGSSLRDFVYVGDVVEANIRCMTRSPGGEDVINIGSGENIAVLDIAKAISDKYEFVPSRPGEAKKTLADNSRAKRILGWGPTVSLLEWLQKSNR